jgi:hypothetical protein
MPSKEVAMKRLLLMLGLTIGAWLYLGTVGWALNISTSPTSFNVAQGMETRFLVIYRGTETLPDLFEVDYPSSSGEFRLPSNEVIGTNPVPMLLDLKSGFGSVTETLSIPVALVERALQRGANSFIYTRTFGGAGARGETVTIAFQITGEAASSFTLKRVELYFDRDRRSIEASVDQYTKGFKAYAELRFVGSGNLRGYWEVDGRILGSVNRHLAIGPTVVLETPEAPPLPTFEAGTHLLRFIVTSPDVAFELPTIAYTVLPAKTENLLEQVLTVSPEPGALLDCLPPTVSWNRLTKPYLYEVVFFSEPEGNQIFTAYAKEPFYTVPIMPFRAVFVPGKTYWWKVRVFGGEGEFLGESQLSMFRFKEN